MRLSAEWYCIWRWLAEAILSLAINVFVCSVILYSEVSSRGYLIASDACVHLQYDVVFKGETSCIWIVGLEPPSPPPPPKKTETRGKSFWRKLHFKYRDIPVALKSKETWQGWDRLKNTTLLWKNGSSFFGIQCNALASLVHFVTYTTKRTRDARAFHWRPEKGLPLFHRRVVFLRFSHPWLVFLYFLELQVHSYLKQSFFQKLSYPSISRSTVVLPGSKWPPVHKV